MSNFNEETMREVVFEVMDELKAELAKTIPGTDKHVAIVKELKDLARVIHDDYEIASVIERDRANTELKEREFKADVLKNERDANFREDQAARNKWYNEPIVQTLITTGAATTLSLAVVYMNLLTENPLKSGASPIFMRTIGWLKK